MTTFKDAQKTPMLAMTKQDGTISRVALTRPTQVGIVGSPAMLLLFGGLSLVPTFDKTEITYLSNDDKLLIRNRAVTSSVYLPTNPEEGQIHIVKDGAGTAGGGNTITVRVASAKQLIDGATTYVMSTSYVATWFVWSGSVWFTL